MHRIVSLIASATEIVCSLGCRDELVGRSHECDYPLSVKSLPVCTEPKFDVEGSSLTIDQRVKAVIQEGLSVYGVHADVLKKLRPTVILTQSHCNVCAVSERDVEAALAGWSGAVPQVVSLAPNSLADVWADMDRVAEALEVPERGKKLAGNLQRRMVAISQRATPLQERPTIACIEWIDPLMAAGNWVPELVEMAGGENLFGTAGQHAPGLTWEELRAKDPEVLVIMPCGFDIGRSRRDIKVLVEKPGWQELRAVRNRRVALADGNHYFNRPGPRLAESLEILGELLHPQAFGFSHEGRGWKRL